MPKNKKIVNPVSFADHFKVAPDDLARLGTLNALLNADTRLFIDPLSLEGSRAPEFVAGAKSYQAYYGDILRLLQNTRQVGDITWEEAKKRLRFKEVSGLGLGYSVVGTSGRGIGEKLATLLIRRAYDIVRLGISDPHLFSLLPLLVEGVGPDLIGDMTSRTIIRDICQYTERICRSLGLPVERAHLPNIGEYELPRNPYDGNKVLLLAAKDVLRPLPVASDRAGVAAAAAEIDQIRKEVNEAIAAIWAAKTREQREAARDKALEDRDTVEALLAAIREANAKSPTSTKSNAASWHDLLRATAIDFPLAIKAPSRKTADELKRVVAAIIDQFRLLIEKKGLWKLLWINAKKAAKEEVAQKIFFGIADSYCKANDLDVTPEANAGPGPVDFKFSKGSNAKLVVEIKKSTNTQLVHGYTKQLEAYRDAEETDLAFYVVIEIGQSDVRVDSLFKKQRELKDAGELVSDIVTIDGTRQMSASKHRT